MRVRSHVLAAAVLGACSGRAATPRAAPIAAPKPDPAGGTLRSVADIATIGDHTVRSQTYFLELSRVLLHPRCANCHPPDQTPRQGDGGLIHDPPVLRGPGDRGVVGMQCASCHQDRNLSLARVPGAPDWRAAPLSMAWFGKSPAEVCTQLVTAARSASSSSKSSFPKVREHLAHDKFVAWGFAPGADRRAAPGTQEEVVALFDAWVASGALCPAARAEVPR